MSGFLSLCFCLYVSSSLHQLVTLYFCLCPFFQLASHTSCLNTLYLLVISSLYLFANQYVLFLSVSVSQSVSACLPLLTCFCLSARLSIYLSIYLLFYCKGPKNFKSILWKYMIINFIRWNNTIMFPKNPFTRCQLKHTVFGIVCNFTDTF